MNHYYSDLKKIKDRGQDKDGYKIWKWQRLSAVALVFLYVWFIWILHQLFKNFEHTIVQVIYSPWQLTLFILLLLFTLLHGSLGIRVICEDYIHTRWLRVTMLLVLKAINIITVGMMVIMGIIALSVVM